MQLLADLACQNAECRRVGDIGVFKCAACGHIKTAYAPDVLERTRVNKLARFITNHRRSKQLAAPASAPHENVAGTGPAPSQSLPTIPEVQRVHAPAPGPEHPGAIPKAKAGAQVRDGP
eukprot:7523989-Alexandrium_andersonii.AAC.1